MDWRGQRAAAGKLQESLPGFSKTQFIARRPLIPGVNDDEEDIRAALDFILPHRNVTEFELLPYMRFSMGNYELLGEMYELKDFQPPSEESLERLRAIIDEAFKSREGA